MNQMVVAVFDNDSAAFEGLRELRNLHKEGGVSLYASAVIVKDKTGGVACQARGGSGAGRYRARTARWWFSRRPRRTRGFANWRLYWRLGLPIGGRFGTFRS